MRSLLSTPIEATLGRGWAAIDSACKKAFLAAVCVSVLAFGFEMTNLTLHHDDVNHILIEDTILGHYLGRFGHGWFHYVLQNHYVMPFLQMAEGIVAMSAYGVLVAHFWGARRPWDLAVPAAIVCTFPYMAQIFQYNTTMAAYPTAYLLAAGAVVLSVRATALHMAIAAVLYVAAFSIYQAVAANAATIFVIWLASRLLFDGDGTRSATVNLGKSTFAALATVTVGGLLYLAAVSMMNLAPDTIHGSDEAFRLGGLHEPAAGAVEILRGTYSFFRWPEPYFPAPLKALQLALLAVAGTLCLGAPRPISYRLAACVLLLLALFTPRALQLLAPKGHFHSLTLTGYALVIAGAVMIAMRLAGTATRNLSIVLSSLLVGGFVLQCNWISTVNYLNTMAHFNTLSQVLARARSLPDGAWDGRKIAVVGSYKMPSTYPYAGATGVATRFLDGKRMGMMARLMRDEAIFLTADPSMPGVLEYASSHPVWPAPGSVGMVSGMAVVVFSKGAPAPEPEQ